VLALEEVDASGARTVADACGVLIVAVVVASGDWQVRQPRKRQPGHRCSTASISPSHSWRTENVSAAGGVVSETTQSRRSAGPGAGAHTCETSAPIAKSSAARPIAWPELEAWKEKQRLDRSWSVSGGRGGTDGLTRSCST
jgi:hypothetical protein